MTATRAHSRFDAAMVALACGAAVVAVSLGIRHGFGLFLKPVTADFGWGRETFALAIAVQNLTWGVSQPFAGMLSDRFGAFRVVAAGAVLYAIGLVLMSRVTGEAAFIFSGGVLIGLGQAGTTYPVIFGAISRVVSAERRSMAMGITMAVSSFGQFIMLPITLGLIGGLSWPAALTTLGALACVMLPLAFGLRARTDAAGTQVEREESAWQALRGACTSRDFWFLAFGFAACGFQVVLIAVHLPAFLADRGIDASVATTVLALIGLVNILGTYLAGLWGGRHSKPMLLVWVYLGRGAVIAAFAFLPVTVTSAYVFGVGMGLFWLSTVPLTNGAVASIWGVRHMSMLGGIVFFVHQLGGFAGGWVGGFLYDRLGSYDIAWAIAIGLSLVAAALNAPIVEKPGALALEAAE